ncbi:MAG: bifunctional diguanylate cyclase/phosphodiesterase [Saccharopolyspora sp.]|uniref:putative bifunctional diguanylate cyclase/phosphodiesterase n=1 Tax=Saccharopolyspora TaxID=1835 RepID=UPI001909FFF9|nr:MULTISPECIES: bifunctional diguanylate cyclase/phosphodiesterase [unclassified Saccharopolyspora]MBK0866317.1 bifunctional diguanylate cyclase/phosphodiesterase [Saccharopolyspora sp. HNM0986]MBQ6644605.1 bifunctional diguanylate cyclase/phosphodiesterase [Saccharopolyspora sp.]
MIERHHTLDPQATLDPPRPPVRAEVDPARRRSFTTFSVLVLLAGLLVSGLTSYWTRHEYGPELLIIGPLLAVGFLLAEQLTIDVDVKRVGWTISFTEIPLILGLLTAPFEVVLAANLLAGLGAQVGRRAATHVVYNAGVFCLEVAVPFAVATAVNNALDDPLNPIAPAWFGPVLGTLTSPLISCGFALAALHVLGGGMRLTAAARLAVRTLAVGLLNTSVGLIGYEVARSTKWGWLLVALVAVAVIGLYRAYSGLLREQRDLEALSDVSLSVARSGQSAVRAPAEAADPETSVSEWEPVAERIREQLNATRVVVRLRLDPRGEVSTLVAGEPLPEAAESASPQALRDDPLLQLPGTHVRSFRTLEAPEEVRRALRLRGAYESLVVPLRGANQLLGAVEAHDRVSRWRGFGQADVRLLHTLASHLATAMDNRRLLARLRHDAYHDLLTGLLNRAGFREMAAEQLRNERTAVVLRVDLDLLTTVSEALGYTWGDRMVVAAGQRMRDELGHEVPLARLEANSFAVLLIDRTEQQAHQLGERLCEVIAEPYPLDRLVVEATGVAGYSSSAPADADDEDDIDTLLQHADVAVRAARNGKDVVRGYAPAMGQVFLRRFQLVTQFRQALDTGQVEVHYQPKVALPGRQVVGAEALVRWWHPEYGRLDPDEFVPVVEATGLVDALTSFVLERALIKVREWLDRDLRMSVAVNLSVRNLNDESFPDRVGEALLRHDIPPELLTFELTESSVMEEPERSMPVLRRLHALGVVLAVDDFGTGYSSLAYLRTLPVDEVKIDKSFVLGMGTDLSDMAVVRTIVELGHSLDLRVVAEGVEDDAARDQLVGMRCDIAQGYLISRPLPEDRFEAWLQARTVKARGSRSETVLTLVH